VVTLFDADFQYEGERGPNLMVLPNFLYALYLLRKIRNDTRLSTH
jgi:hypothetical protein